LSHPLPFCQLAGLLQQREWYAYALTAAHGLVPACRAAYASAGIKKLAVATDIDAVTLVREVVEMHARLGARQHEAETRMHRALEVPYQTWVCARNRGGFSNLKASPEEVGQVQMHTIYLYIGSVCNMEAPLEEGAQVEIYT